MPTQTFHIPAPSGSIGVVIKNSSNVTVYSATQGNTPFDVILPAGDYTIYTTFEGAENGWCFNVPDCECPVFDHIETEMGTGEIFYGYAHFYFDMSGGFGCPFNIAGTIHTDVGSVSTFLVSINSLSDFSGNVGSMYFKTIWVGGFATYIDYNIYLPPSSTGSTQILCDEGTHSIGCVGPTLPVSITGVYFSGNYSIDITYTDCGVDCNTITWNYIQTSPIGSIIVPDSGTFTDTVSCVGLPQTVNHVVNPDFGILPPTSTTLRYVLTATDCCGNVYSWRTNSRLIVTIPTS